MVSRLHCGAQLALILAQITQPVPVLPPFEGNRNLVTESVFLFFFHQVKMLPWKTLRNIEILLPLGRLGLFSQRKIAFMNPLCALLDTVAQVCRSNDVSTDIFQQRVAFFPDSPGCFHQRKSDQTRQVFPCATRNLEFSSFPADSKADASGVAPWGWRSARLAPNVKHPVGL